MKQKEIITRTFNEGKFRMKVVKLAKDLVSIQEEMNYGDAYGWVRGRCKKIHRDEIEAAAKLLGIVD